MENDEAPPASGSHSPPPFSAILNELIERRGWDVAEASRRSGIPYSTLLGWTKGGLDDSLARLPRLARELGTVTGSLLGDPAPAPEIGVNQLLVTHGQCLVDPDRYKIVDEGGELPRSRPWAFEVRPGVRVASDEEVNRMNAALRAKKGRRR